MRSNKRVSSSWLDSRLGALSLAAMLAGCGATRHQGQKTDDGSDPRAQGGAGGDSDPGPGVGAGSSLEPTHINLEGAPKYFRFVRLTNEQWAASVQEVLRLPEPSQLAEAFAQSPVGVSDFSNNETLLNIDSRRWQDFQAAAEELAARVTASDEALKAVYPGNNVDGLIETVGRRAYRRPLSADEIDRLRELFDLGAAMSGEQSSFAKGAALVIRGLLQSPYFLFRTELGEAGAPLDGYEAAAKLSLWLRGTTPSDELLDIAPSLTTAGAVESEAKRLLEDAAARAVVRRFHDEYLRLSWFDQVSKTGVPSYDPSLNSELKESAVLFFDQVFQRGSGLREVLTSTRGYVGPGMAALYGVAPPASGLVEVELGERRAGYFSQVPYLTLFGINATPDSIRRGLFITLDVLCSTLGPAVGEIPPPPPARDGLTNRQRVTELTASCGGTCHNELINPLGFAFEHFDGMGQYRETEGDLPIDSSGEFTFDEGTRAFADNVELMNAIADSRQAHLCYAKKIAGYGLQRDIVEADLPWLSEIASSSQNNGSLKEAMLEIARSEAFRIRAGAQP